MSDLLQARFNDAVEARKTYAAVAINARAAKHRFAALTYLVYREGQRHPDAYQEMVRACLPQEPTGPEEKRPFLLLLHAIIERADRIEAVQQLSKLAGALEEIDRAFGSEEGDPDVEDLLKFIEEQGGITGLYDQSREPAENGESTGLSDESQQGGENGSPDTSSASSTRKPRTRVKPREISLPKLDACVTKVGKEHRIKMLKRKPGKYPVLLVIDEEGFIESILYEDLNQKAT